MWRPGWVAVGFFAVAIPTLPIMVCRQLQLALLLLLLVMVVVVAGAMIKRSVEVTC